MDEHEELYSLYATLQKHGITIDEVEGGSWRWIISYSPVFMRESLERWPTAAQALDAALSVMFSGEPLEGVEA